MSQSLRGRPGRSEEGPTRLTGSDDVQQVLDAVDDPDCRAILEATRDEWRTVGEIGDACDLPQSTAYRKVNDLAEAGLLEESLRIQSSGSHVSTYSCGVGDLTLTVGDDGVELTLQQEDPAGAESLAAPADD